MMTTADEVGPRSLEHSPERTNFISVVTDDGVEHTIRVAGTVYEPYFVGVDVCKIMDLKNHNDAILKLVDINHKKELKNLLKEENNGTL
jgi:prophage antirepressor-like protein